MNTRNLALTLITAALSTVVSLASMEAAATDTPYTVDKKQARADNRALSGAVRKVLTRVKGLDSSRINVLARGGVVTLAGSAPDQAQILSAGSAAANVSGVSRVDNRLTIKEAGR